MKINKLNLFLVWFIECGVYKIWGNYGIVE